MTPFEIIVHNRKVLKDNIGSSSYMITFDHVPNAFDSLSGRGSMMRNDVPFLLSKEETNASIYFKGLLNAAARTAIIIGKEHENWEEIAENFSKWCADTKSKSGRGCPYKFYYTNYSVYNVNWWWRMAEKIRMMFGNHQFVAHLVRDRALDKNGGGYFIQIHCYKPAYGTYRPEHDELEDKFISTLYDQLCQLSREVKCPCSILTNPSIFGRLKDWAVRCYFRYNSFCYGLIQDIKAAFQGNIYQPNTRN